MRKINKGLEEDILARLSNGESYESAADGRVSKSTVNRIVKDAEKEIPDYWDYREMKIKLDQYGFTFNEVIKMIENRFPIVEVEVYRQCPPEQEIPCKRCNAHFMVRLIPASTYRYYLAFGQFLQYRCPCCGYVALYSPLEVLGFFGLSILDEEEHGGL
jgi:hypothetical protein